MRELVLDCEWKTTERNDKIDGSPYNPENFLVSVGYDVIDNGCVVASKYIFIQHDDLFAGSDLSEIRELQDELDKADLFIAHNVKGDLKWLRHCGFKYDGATWDTMIAEHVLARGQKPGLSLEDIALRRCVAAKKSDLVQPYLDKGMTYNQIPMHIVEDYGRQDVQTCYGIYRDQLSDLESAPHLRRTIEMMCQVTDVIIDMEDAGISIDMQALEELDAEYKARQTELNNYLKRKVHEYMGDTPINLASPEQLSQFIYSRKVIDKTAWAEKFNLGSELRGSVKKAKRKTRMSLAEFGQSVRTGTRVLSRTVSKHCQNCGGSGRVEKYTAKGSLYKILPRCGDCQGNGYILTPTGVVAGLKCIPEDPSDTAVGGFITGGAKLEYLAQTAREQGKEEVSAILNAILELNAIDSYRSTYLEGVRKAVRPDGTVHSTLSQTVVATCRLASSDPNLHNWPREQTFPLRRVVKSRWEGGQILDVDLSQLEYTCAVFQANCPYGRQSVIDNVDRHRLTASVMEGKDPSEIEPNERQEAKSRTFKPLYGGTTGTAREMEYYKWFMEVHTGVAEWHEQLKQSVLKTGIIRLPTGREFIFPDARRYQSGYVSYSTQIVNYPVQSFATGDIVPLTSIYMKQRFDELRKSGLKSLFIWTVHDSFLFDVHPGEEQSATDNVRDIMSHIPDYLKTYYNIIFDLPLRFEMKLGPNWLRTKRVY